MPIVDRFNTYTRKFTLTRRYDEETYFNNMFGLKITKYVTK